MTGVTGVTVVIVVTVVTLVTLVRHSPLASLGYATQPPSFQN